MTILMPAQLPGGFPANGKSRTSGKPSAHEIFRSLCNDKKLFPVKGQCLMMPRHTWPMAKL